MDSVLVLVVQPDVTSNVIAPGSGIVTAPSRGSLVPAGSLDVWFEGNVYGAVNLRSWADRVHTAADRALTRYPTTSHAFLPAEDFQSLGFYDPTSRRFDWQVPNWRDALAGWLGHEPGPQDLQVSGFSTVTQ